MNVPELRFPEFSGEWEEKKIQDIANTIDGDRSNRYPNEKDIVGEGIVFLSTANIVNNKLDFNEKRFITKEKYDELSKGQLVQNDLIVTLRGSIGNIVLFKTEKFETGFINAQMMIIRLHKDYNSFFYNWYLNPKTQNNILKVSSGSAQPQLTKYAINNLKINIPPIKEQEKIASFLSKVDEKIEKLEKKQELWETYKKGMMQNIFLQKLRFKDETGENYPDWEWKLLGEITDIKTGNKDLKDKVANGKYSFFVRSDNIERINSFSYNGEAILIPGDGKIGEVYHYINGKFDYHQRVYKISDFETNVHGKYIYYYLKKNFLKQAMKNSVKATVDSLRLPTIKEMTIELPSISEQIKIANLFSAIDFRVNYIKKEIEFNNLFKKGLLQKMFC